MLVLGTLLAPLDEVKEPPLDEFDDELDDELDELVDEPDDTPCEALPDELVTEEDALLAADTTGWLMTSPIMLVKAISVPTTIHRLSRCAIASACAFESLRIVLPPLPPTPPTLPLPVPAPDAGGRCALDRCACGC